MRPRRARLPVAMAAIALFSAACTSPPSTAAADASAVLTSPSLAASPPPAVLSIDDAGYRLAAPVERSVAATAGSTVYIAGGLDASGVSVGGVFSMDPSTGALASVGSMPAAFHDAAGALIGDRLVVFGGGQATSTDTVQAFDISSQKSAVIGHLPVALSDLAAATVGTTTYLFGGYDGSRPRAEIYATTDGMHFRLAGMLPQGLRYPAVTAVGDAVVVAGGQGPHGLTDAVSVFEPTSGKVRLIGRLPSPVGHAAAFTLGPIAYLAGGRNAGDTAVAAVIAVDPVAGSVVSAGELRQPLADTAVAQGTADALLIGGWRGIAVRQVLSASLRTDAPVKASSSPPTANGSSTNAAGTGLPASSKANKRPFAGLLLIADRGNNRLLVMNAGKRIVWTYPSPSLPPPPHRFYFPDDAFWVHHGHAILVNEEENNMLTEIAYPSGRTLWTYGHPGVSGSSAGYVHQPDDLYPYRGGGLVVADAKNCRILFLGPSGNPQRQIGTTGNCTAGLPKTVGYPNGDTPLPNGHLLISELNGAGISEVTSTGDVVWSHRVPGVVEPSDPQRLSDGTYLVASYAAPGAVIRFTGSGQVLWTYHPTAGPGMLDHPSLAAPLPNGLIAVNDDYNHRIVLIDPKTKRIVWQYGTGVSGSSPGHLSFPDGLDLLLPGSVIPMHVDFPTAHVRMGRP